MVKFKLFRVKASEYSNLESIINIWLADNSKVEILTMSQSESTSGSTSYWINVCLLYIEK